MTAKEKAQTRCYYYWVVLEPVIKDEQIRGATAIKCAIVEAEEILKESTLLSREEYWKEVLTELNKAL